MKVLTNLKELAKLADHFNAGKDRFSRRMFWFVKFKDTTAND